MDLVTSPNPAAVPDRPEGGSTRLEQFRSSNLTPPPVPLPPRPGPIPLYRSATMGPIIARVMEQTGTHQAEVARRMGTRPQSLNQYVKNKRSQPSLDWMLHFLSVQGAALVVVFPRSRGWEDVVNEAARQSVD